MPWRSKILRVVAWVIAGLCVIVFVAAATVRVDEYWLRRKAERFLADLKSLEMRKSTYQDARLVIDRWKDDISERGLCQPNRCDVVMGIGDFWNHHSEFFAHHKGLEHVWRVLGGRRVLIDGYIRVRNGVVWGKGIRALFVTYSAENEVDLVGRMGSWSPGFISLLHPEYYVSTGRPTSSALGALAEFTPYADPADVKRLMDIDFSCLTRWRPCQTGADIAPTAWNEATAEEKKRRAARNSAELACSPDAVRVLARESRRAVIGEVSRIRPWFKLHGDPYSADVKILLKDDLKQCNFSFLSVLQNYSFSESLPVKRKLGDHYVLFYRYPDGLYSDTDRACDLLPATKENLEAVQRGVAEDWADHDGEF